MLLMLLVFFLFFVITRCLYIIFNIHYSKSYNESHSRKEPAKTLICIGSGGHTTEMLIIVKSLNPQSYSPRIYVMANTDTTSESKIHETEKQMPHSSKQYSIIKIARSRKVLQSYFTSIFTTIYSTIMCVPILIKTNPDLILCNGPGTCVPLCVIGFLCKVFYLNKNLKIVFIESFCRVKSISLTGKILNVFADDIIVQWEELLKICKRAKYFGRLT